MTSKNTEDRRLSNLPPRPRRKRFFMYYRTLILGFPVYAIMMLILLVGLATEPVDSRVFVTFSRVSWFFLGIAWIALANLVFLTFILIASSMPNLWGGQVIDEIKKYILG